MSKNHFVFMLLGLEMLYQTPKQIFRRREDNIYTLTRIPRMGYTVNVCGGEFRSPSWVSFLCVLFSSGEFLPSFLRRLFLRDRLCDRGSGDWRRSWGGFSLISRPAVSLVEPYPSRMSDWETRAKRMCHEVFCQTKEKIPRTSYISERVCVWACVCSCK